jgi:hypothetical protein
MNNKVKIALVILAGSSLILLNLRRRKNIKSKTYTAPDGNTYRENQIYRTLIINFTKMVSKLLLILLNWKKKVTT